MVLIALFFTLLAKPYQGFKLFNYYICKMKYTENAINILTVKSYKGIGNAWIVQNLKGNECVATITSKLVIN